MTYYPDLSECQARLMAARERLSRAEAGSDDLEERRAKVSLRYWERGVRQKSKEPFQRALALAL